MSGDQKKILGVFYHSPHYSSEAGALPETEAHTLLSFLASTISLACNPPTSVNLSAGIDKGPYSLIT